ncbi:MAG: thiamine pyrophosphate-binding protein [Actinomycetia bacterium]|nr:thiamine pyrophosphate-binding protein [Actinomycetes bacterium]MCP4961292.1 thiamine pyrophosphate-binding protein [Actinomycetes bacterium]
MARQLAEEGVSHIFGIPGVQLDYATNGLAAYRDQITFINVRHEHTTTYAADGYSRTTGRVGVALVVPGPGVLNATAGLATALACSSKILLVAGQIPTRGIGKGLGLLHEIPDQSGVLEGLCHSSTLVTDPGQVAGALHGAFVQLGSGPGPVAVEIPPDVLSDRTEGSAIGAEPSGSPAPGDAADLGAAAERLLGASRPLIYVGGGARAADAWDELHRLAEQLGAPLVASTGGKGGFDERHPLGLLPLTHHEMMWRADLVLVVGSRTVSPRAGALKIHPDAFQISLNTDPNAFTAPREFDLTITGDARTGVAALASLVEGQIGGDQRACWVDDLDDVRARAHERLAGLEPQLSYSRALRDAMPDDAVLVNELTQVGYVSRYAFPVHHRRSYVDPGYQGTLGYGYPTAIGAAVGNPDRPVISINGDGGFGYGMSEMATVMNHNIPLIGVVFRDDAFGNVQRMHRQQFDGDHHGTELYNPDMLALASAYDMPGYRAETPDELRAILAAAIDARCPALIDVPMGPTPDPWGPAMRPWEP